MTMWIVIAAIILACLSVVMDAWSVREYRRAIESSKQTDELYRKYLASIGE